MQDLNSESRISMAKRNALEVEIDWSGDLRGYRNGTVLHLQDGKIRDHVRSRQNILKKCITRHS